MEIDVPAQRISEIVTGRRVITADTHLRRCRFFGLCSGYWLRAQAVHDTEVAERELAPVLKRIRPWLASNGRQRYTAPLISGISQRLKCGAAARSRCQWYAK